MNLRIRNHLYDFWKPRLKIQTLNSIYGKSPNLKLGLSSFWGSFRLTAQSITPFIGLRARLSQIWFNRFSIVLLIISIKLILFRRNLKYSLGVAELYTKSSCQSMQSFMSNVISMPNTLAQTADMMLSDAMSHSITGIVSTFTLLITGLENLLVFALDIWIGTYACLIVSAIDGTASAAINATEVLVDFADNEAKQIGQDINDALGALTDAFDTMENIVSDVGDFFSGGQDSIKKVNLTVAALQNFTIPATINTQLSALRRNLPTYDDVKNKTEAIISVPFDELKEKLKKVSNSIRFEVSPFDISPSKEVEFCSDSGITEFFIRLNKDIDFVFKVAISLTIVAALLWCIPMAYHEYRHWIFLNDCAEEDRVFKKVEHHNKRLNSIIKSSSFYQTKVDILFTQLFDDTTKATLARWLLDYVFYDPMLTLLCVGLAGVLVSAIQYIILDLATRQAPVMINTIVKTTENADKMLETNIQLWVNRTNTAINSTQYEINQNLLGWIETGTSAINTTFNEFSTIMGSNLNKTFSGTPLEDPISTVMKCIIGNKITEIEKGLDWVHENSQIRFPLINSSLIPLNSTSSASLISMENTTSNLLGLIMPKLFQEYRTELQIQLLISIAIISLWIIIVIAGFLYCTYRYKMLKQISKHDEDAASQTSPIYSNRHNLAPLPPPPPPIEDGWSLKSFQPPLLSAYNSNISSPAKHDDLIIPSPGAETIMEIRDVYSQSIEIDHHSGLDRKSEYGLVERNL